MKKSLSKTKLSRRLSALLLALVMLLSPIFTACSKKEKIEIPVDPDRPRHEAKEPEEGEKQEIPDDDAGEEEKKLPVDEDGFEDDPYGSSAGVPCEDPDLHGAACDYTCINSEHEFTYFEAYPGFIYDFSKQNVTLSHEDGVTGEMLKAEAFAGIEAHDGKNRVITDKIVIDTVNGLPYNDATFDWDALASIYRPAVIVLSVTNTYGLKSTLPRRITVADIPKLSFDESLFTVEDGKIVLIAGQSLSQDALRAALNVTDRSDNQLTASDAFVSDWGGYNSTTPGIYMITVSVTNAAGIQGRITKTVLIKARPDPFRLEGQNHITILAGAGISIRRALENGVTAVDVLKGDVTGDISVLSVKVDAADAVFGGFNWGSLDNKVCTVTVVFRVLVDGVSFTLTRSASTAAIPAICINQNGLYAWSTELPNGGEGFAVALGTAFEIEQVLSVEDLSDPSLGASSVLVTGYIDTQSSGIYPMTLTVTNRYGYSDTKSVSVWVMPSPDAVLTLQGNPNCTLVKPTAADIKAAVFDGLSAQSNGDDLTAEIKILSVNGIAYEMLTDAAWDALASNSGKIVIVMGVKDIYADIDRYVTVTRIVSVASQPVLHFDHQIFNTSDDRIIEVEMGAAIDYMRAISVTDESDYSLNKSTTEIKIQKQSGEYLTAQEFNTAEPGLYQFTLRIKNASGITSEPLVFYISVVQPSPVITVTSGAKDLLIAKTDYAGLEAAALSGLTAHDGEGGDITGDLGIYSVGGVKVDGAFDGNAAAATLGTVTVRIYAVNDYGRITYFNRDITIVDIPMISFRHSDFVIEEGLVRIFTGESMNLYDYLSVSDATDPSITQSDIVITGEFDTNKTGTYQVTFTAKNAFGFDAVPLTISFRVRDKLLSDHTAFEIYDILQARLANSYYTASGHNQASWEGGGYVKEGFYHATDIVNNASRYSYNYRTAGWQMYFLFTYGDFNRANEFVYNKNTGSMTLQKAKAYRNSSRDAFYDGSNWKIAATEWNSSAQSSLSEFQSYFGRPLMQDSEFNITPQTVSSSDFRNLGGNRYQISFDLSVPNGRASSGIKGRQDFLWNLMSTDGSSANVSFRDNDLSARLTYIFDGNLRVESKRVEEVYSMGIDYAAIYAKVTNNMVISYKYDAVQPSANELDIIKIKTQPSFSSAELSDPETVEKPHFETKDSKNNDYCAYSGCCICCDVCFPKDENGELITSRPSPIITTEGELSIRKGLSDGAFYQELLRGVTGDDGFGNDATDLIRIRAIDGVGVDDPAFSYGRFSTAVGDHTVTYYLRNADSGRTVTVERNFYIGSAPVISVWASKTESAIANVGGNQVGVTAIVVLRNSAVDLLSYISVSDESDPSVSVSSVKIEGSVNSAENGVYKIVYTATNKNGVTTSRTQYFKVRGTNAREEMYALDAYRRIGETMRESTFIAVTKGSGVAAGNGMVLYSYREHSGNETYFENMSNGGKPWGVNADFAKKVYRNGDSYRMSSAEGGFSNSNGVVTGMGWSGAANWTKAQFEDAFGRGVDDITNYAITSSSINNPSDGIGFNAGTGLYDIAFELKIDQGANSEAVRGYVKQIPTMSGGKTCPDFYKAIITMRFYEDFRLADVSVYENYQVNSGTIAGKVDMSASLTDSYSYPASLTVRSF